MSSHCMKKDLLRLHTRCVSHTRCLPEIQVCHTQRSKGDGWVGLNSTQDHVRRHGQKSAAKIAEGVSAARRREEMRISRTGGRKWVHCTSDAIPSVTIASGFASTLKLPSSLKTSSYSLSRSLNADANTTATHTDSKTLLRVRGRAQTCDTESALI